MVLSLVNLVFLIYFFRYLIKNLIINWITISLSIFLLASLISFVSATNQVESIISISKICILIVTSYFIGVSIINNDNYKKDFLIFLISCLSIEVFYFIIDYFLNYSLQTYTGISTNRNISSFSILIKLPFLFYLSHINKRKISFLLFIELISAASIILLESRSAIFLLFAFYLSILIKNIISKDLNSIKRYSLKSLALILFLGFYYQNFSIYLKNKQLSISTIVIDESFQNRANYIDISSEMIKNNPINGFGLGMWKLESLKYFNSKDKSLIVPYYAHNDFIQIISEMGYFGLVSYLLLFLIVIRSLYKDYRRKEIGFYITLSILVMLVDSSINFPFYRPQEIISFIVIFCFVKGDDLIQKKINNIPIIVIASLLIVASLFISIKETESLVDQKILLNDLYNEQYSLSLDEIKEIEYTIPNIASNTLPISSLLARYYINEGLYEPAIYHLEKGIKNNPFLDYNYEQKIIAHLLNNEFESAKIIAKRLYLDNNNELKYADLYFQLISYLNSEDDFIEIFPEIDNLNFDIINLYFNYYSQIKNLDKKVFLRLIDSSLSNQSNKFLNDLKEKISKEKLD
tara:strand:+ start:5536 stop:7266 length:1731 start_codon:yes stop_codon:yes gene_type:complete